MERFGYTIAALSTPPGESGIAVIRLSGHEAFPILLKTFVPAAGRKLEPRSIEHRRVYVGDITAPNGEVLDRVVVSTMRGPDSYTGEDVVEISSHGSMPVAGAILDLLYTSGAAEAEAGEFTKRAFLNGKMDLIQAEAVCDLIHARSELQRKVAAEQMSGTLSLQINSLAGEMLDLLGNIEAGIDFIEEDIEHLDKSKGAELLKEHISRLEGLMEGSEFSRPFRDGCRLALTGPANSGKSSIFNKLLGENRAIVTEIPGTTRDVLREYLVIDGLVFICHDTAGHRDGSKDKIESIGADKAASAAGSADIIMYVHDSSLPISKDEGAVIESLDSKRTLLVLNKIDLRPSVDGGYLSERLSAYKCMQMSALTGEGLDRLKSCLLDIAGRDYINRISKERIVLNSRLISLLRRAQRSCSSAKELMESGESLEILAVEVGDALACYEEATGRKYTESLLDNIFSRFCIGK